MHPAFAGRGDARKNETTTMDSSVFFTIALLHRPTAGPLRARPRSSLRRLGANQLDAHAFRVIELAVQARRPAVPEAVDLPGRLVAVRQVRGTTRHRRPWHCDESR